MFSIYIYIYIYIYVCYIYIYIYICTFCRLTPFFLSARKAEGPVEEVAALPTLAEAAEKVSSATKAWGSRGMGVHQLEKSGLLGFIGIL